MPGRQAGQEALPGMTVQINPGSAISALKPVVHGVRTHWIRGFMMFHLVRGLRRYGLDEPDGGV